INGITEDWDNNDIVVPNVSKGIQICSHRAVLEYTNFIRFFNNSDESFVTGGKSNPRVWDIDCKNTKFIINEIVQGHIRRIWTIAVIKIEDKHAYMGSTARDIIINKDNELINESQITVLKTAVPTRGLPMKVAVNDGVIPVVTAELSLISREKDPIRPSKHHRN
ncbi:MAG: hypothetical protein EZS28_054707, partial [Streblomastix strix]